MKQQRFLATQSQSDQCKVEEEGSRVYCVW